MSSHILAEVSHLAGRIGIIHNGCLLREMNIDELERDRQRRLLIQVRDVETAHRILITAGQPAEILHDGTIEIKDAFSIERPDEINRILVNAGTPPTRLVVEEEALEQFFLRLVGMDRGQ